MLLFILKRTFSKAIFRVFTSNQLKFQFFVIYMATVNKWIVFSMAQIELQMKEFCHGLKQDFCLRFLSRMNQYLILKNVNLLLKKKNTTQQELLFGMNSKWLIVLLLKHQCLQNKSNQNKMSTISLESMESLCS